MPRVKKFTAEQIIGKIREAELAQGKTGRKRSQPPHLGNLHSVIARILQIWWLTPFPLPEPFSPPALERSLFRNA
jgi:hypothetical protein